MAARFKAHQTMHDKKKFIWVFAGQAQVLSMFLCSFIQICQTLFYLDDQCVFENHLNCLYKICQYYMYVFIKIS